MHFFHIEKKLLKQKKLERVTKLVVKKVQTKSSSTTERIDFSKISGTLDLPYLVEIQTESFNRFVKEGIVEVFNDIYPIVSPNENIVLKYMDYRFDEPKYSIEECRNRDITYSRPLKVRLGLFDNEYGEIKVSEVFMGDFPWMTESGTFIVNGAERVIVSQLVRSPGVYFSQSRDKSGQFIYGGDIIPGRGTWLQFETDAKGLINVRIDRNRKVLATVLLGAIGLTSKERITELFGEDNFDLLSTIEKDTNLTNEAFSPATIIRNSTIEIYNKLRPGEPATEEGARILLFQKFFDPRRYDLAKAGRFKFQKKLGLYNRLLDQDIAEDLVDENGEVIYTKGTHIGKEEIKHLKDLQVFEKGAHSVDIQTNTSIESAKGEGNGVSTVQVIEVYVDDQHKKTTKIIGTDLRIDAKCLTISDIIAAFSYYLNLMVHIGNTDDIDHLGNRRIKTIGELLQNQFRIGLSRMERSVKEKMTIAETDKITAQNLTNTKPLTSAIKEFFSSSQLSQFMDQTNPLAELTNKRRLSALGPGGLSRERAGMEVRDVHTSHYGRICPIETPDGPNIGLINNLATYAKVNEYGFLETPYRKVNKEADGRYRVLEDAEYLSADDEFDKYIAQANVKLDSDHCIAEDMVVARYMGENIMAPKELIDYVDVSPKQIVSVAAACIPFLENDDAKRALMGANMQRQAIPLLKPEAPFVGTGIEKRIAHDSGLAVVANDDGLVTYVDSRKIIVAENGQDHTYHMSKFARSNQGTAINQTPIVKKGDKVKAGQVIADGPAMQNGELALGQNVTIAFMTWDGYNYEDAVIMSERMVRDDVYTSIHIEEYDVECRDTKLGPEEITRDIPNVSEDAKSQLDENGIVIPGAEVKEGDILVGKITPKGQSEPTPEEKLLMAIFGDKTKDSKDNSLRVPHGGAGIILDVKIFSRAKGDELPVGVNEVVRVFVVQKRKISEGDKMAGRHGNKGVISRILPIEDMPYLADGTPIDIMLNPLGVPSRMNIGQVLEVHLGIAAKKLGVKVATSVFDGCSNEELADFMAKAQLDKDGKAILYDGRTGEPFDERITVGVMYMIKLAHMVDDKLHARATGPYSLVTQQPLGGKAQNGGQRFGEMEVWALEAYGAAHTLQEILTVKSDDMIGRAKTYEAITKGNIIPDPGIPESFRVLQKELQSLAIDVKVIDKEGNEVDMKEVSKLAEKEERRISAYAKEAVSDVRYEANPYVSEEGE